MRVFIGIFLPPTIITHVMSHLNSRPAIDGIRWIPPESLHITLKFLGDIEASQVPGVLAVMEGIAASSPVSNLHLESGGVFPSLANPRVFWVGLKGEEEKISHMAGSMERQLDGLGYPPENRRYSPHVTVGRAQKGHLSTVAGQFDILIKTYRSPDFNVKEISFVKSILSSRGVRYEPIGHAALRS